MKSAGFTLLEILLVFSLIVSLTSAGALALSQLQSLFRARATADEIRALFQLARQRSLNRLDQDQYQVTLTNNLFDLTTVSGRQLEHYQPPVGATFTPEQLSWAFQPVTGQVQGCTPPCQILIDFGPTTQTITIYQNGLVD